MLEAKLLWFAAAGVLFISVITYAALRRGDVGQGRFFADQSYHFQTLRVMNDVPSDGADTAEVLETIKHIRSGDAQGWFRAWSDTGDRVARLAATTTDPIAKGRALLRAHNYYRTAEFFLPPEDAKRPVSSAKNSQSFYAGLDALGVVYQRIKVPYGGRAALPPRFTTALRAAPSTVSSVHKHCDTRISSTGCWQSSMMISSRGNDLVWSGPRRNYSRSGVRTRGSTC